MKEAKRAWWRVPVFCVLAGQVCFRLELALGRRFAIIRLSDGSVSVNNERWLLISAALFGGQQSLQAVCCFSENGPEVNCCFPRASCLYFARCGDLRRSLPKSAG